MTPFNLLHSNQMMDWVTLLYGMEEGYLTLSDINNYAQDLLASTERENADFYTISLIASSQDWTEIKDLIKQISKTKLEKQKEQQMALKKWQFAFLKNTVDSISLTDEDKIEKIQYLYSEFLYPENMRYCSIYAQNNTAPIIEECKKVVHQLDKEINNPAASGRGITGRKNTALS